MEIVQNRVDFSTSQQRFFMEKAKNLQLQNELAQLGKVQFLFEDVSKVPALISADGKPVTHLYAFNRLFSESNNLAFLQLVETSP
jgi:hypothetical protein